MISAIYTKAPKNAVFAAMFKLRGTPTAANAVIAS